MDLNEKQKEILEKFKAKIGDVIRPSHDDPDLVKWLRARNFNLAEAEKMYRNSMMWRKTYKADSLLDTYVAPEVLAKYYGGGVCGQDKEKRPIIIDTLGKTDLKGILLSCTQDEVIKFGVAKAETMQKLFEDKTKHYGKRIDQVVQVLDLDGFGRRQMYRTSADLIVKLLKVIDHNYPEMLYRTYIINAPTLFQLGYSVIKPFLSEETRSKFRFLGSNWKQQLKVELGTDEYPVHWGGKLTDEDGDVYCKSKICMGGIVPEEYYGTNINKKDTEDHTKVTVRHGSVHKVEMTVTNVEDVLIWNFFTEDKNIEFGINFYKSKTDKPTVIESMRSVNCHIIPESGSYVCENTGLYTSPLWDTALTRKTICLIKILILIDLNHKI